MRVQSLNGDDPLEEMAPHSSILAWEIQDKNTNPIISRQDYDLTQPCPPEGKNKQKINTNLTLQEAYTNHWTNFRRAESKQKKKLNLEAES